jgi:hypothetical protein
MQEVRYDGTEQLSQVTSAEQIQKAVEDPRNKTVLVHKPGSIITLRSGAAYRVANDGSWRRVRE